MTAPIEILLVEDNPGDVRLAEETLKEYNLQNRIVVVGDGEEALHYLRGIGKYAARSLPDLIMLDLNLPKIDGVEVLAELQKDEVLREIPTVVLTVSDTDEEMVRSFRVPASCYVVKPLTVDKYLEALRCYRQFGLAIVRVKTA